MASDMASDIPVACTLSAAELRARGEDVVGPLFARAQRLQETPDGYRFAFPAEADGVRDLLGFILSERDCCPFFTFELAFPSPHESVWLTLRGGEGVKEFVAGSFAAAGHAARTGGRACSVSVLTYSFGVDGATMRPEAPFTLLGPGVDEC